MGAEKESGSDVPGDAGSPRPCDSPRPVVAVEESSPLAAKIAKLAENLTASSALTRNDLVGGAAAAPALITSGSLFEAKAYLAHVEPLREEEPITIEMQRVRIAEDVNAASWVTERIERAAQGDAERKGRPTPSSAASVEENRPIASETGNGAGAQGRKSASKKAAFVGVLVAGLAAAASGYVLFARQAPPGTDVLSVQAAELANAALFERMEALGLMSDKEVVSAEAVAAGPTASGRAHPGISAASKPPLPARQLATPPRKSAPDRRNPIGPQVPGPPAKGARQRPEPPALVTEEELTIPGEIVQ